MKVLLLFPPCWHPIMPHLALPSLTAYLRAKGIQVIQRDLNLEVYDEVLSRHHLSTLVRRLQREERLGKSPAIGSDVRGSFRSAHKLLSWAVAEGNEIASQVEQAKAILRSSRFYEAATGLQSLLTLTDGLSLASAPYFPSRVHFTGYDSAYPIDASAAILAAVRDRQRNPFYDILNRLVIPQIVRERPDVIGISLTSASQVIAAFTLAHLIKESGSKAHITLGGKMITCWRELLPARPQLFSLIDSAVVYAGEMPLYRLLEALDSRKELSALPNLIYRDDDKIRCNEVTAPETVASLPPPDFHGLPLQRYLAPEPVLPVSASRGCYWHRCAFCNVGYRESATYEEKQADRVQGEMIALAQEWGVRHFFFCDEAVSPRILKLLSRQLLARGTHFHWTGAARFEPSLDAETLQQMARAGCRMLMFGLESGSPRILQKINKGISLETARRVLRDSAQAGIWNHIFFFFGFPGETSDEAQETLRFFRENREYIHSACSGTFMLERYSGVEANPQSYGVSRIMRPHDRDLLYYYDYEAASGMSAEEAERTEACFLDSLPRKERAHLYFHDIYRFLYASQFDPQTPFPPMLPSGR